jgi:hypothetical protein
MSEQNGPILKAKSSSHLTIDGNLEGDHARVLLTASKVVSGILELQALFRSQLPDASRPGMA